MKLKSMFKKVGFMTLAIPMLLLGMVTGASAEDNQVEKTVDYSCSGPTINFNMEATIKANAPNSVAPNGNVTFEDAEVTVKLPPLVVEALRFVYFANAISGEVTTFNISSDNSVKTINAADSPIAIPQTNLPPLGQSLEFTVPQGGIDVGPFTAGNQGVMNFTAGAIDVTVIAHRTLLPDTEIDVACTPVNGDLITIPIVTE